jgi:ketosteroid isomerase-like protein
VQGFHFKVEIAFCSRGITGMSILVQQKRGYMGHSVEVQIADAEDRLMQAMRDSDVGALDDLLAQDLVFTNHLGQLVGKDDDLAAYRSGALEIRELKPSEQKIQTRGEAAIVSVRVQLKGTYSGNPANGDFRFTRVWVLSRDKKWQVAAAHSCVIA